MCCELWSVLQQNLKQILNNNEYYSNILTFLNKTNNNILLYGQHGFPTDLLIDEILKAKFELSSLQKQHCIWGKDIPYIYNQHFLELDFTHPDLGTKFANISKFLIHVITNKHISKQKHYIILKHIDVLSTNDFSCLRIILERYSKNVTFLCSSHKLDAIDVPVKSRFTLVRVPLLQFNEILQIFDEYFKVELNEHLKQIKTRDLIKAIFIAEVEKSNKQIATKDFCLLNYPPLMEFIANFDTKKNNLEKIRKISYDMFQYNISLVDVMKDLLKIMPEKKKKNIILSCSAIDHTLCLTNNGREPIYIETYLCQVLL